MPKTKTVLSSLATAALIIGVAGGALSLTPDNFNPRSPVAKSHTRMTYEPINPKIKMASAWGDRASGAHGTFGLFEPNFQTPIHSHTFAYHGVVVSGIMTNPFGPNGEKKPTKMAAGSYWYVPAGTPHSTACVSDTPCWFYFHSDGGFDFTPLK